MLIMAVGARRCALPVAHVIETMRPLPIEPVASAPAFVLGVAVVRGGPVPVVDLAALQGEDGGEVARFVTVHAGGRTVALAVSGIVGVRTLDGVALHDPPPLLADANPAIEALGTLDGALLAVLRTGRVIPEEAIR